MTVENKKNICIFFRYMKNNGVMHLRLANEKKKNITPIYICTVSLSFVNKKIIHRS